MRGAAAVIHIGEHITTAAEALTVQRYIGPASNNVAEYSDLILGLQAVHNHCPNVCNLIIKGDSELVLRPMDPLYSWAGSDGLKPSLNKHAACHGPFNIFLGGTYGDMKALFGLARTISALTSWQDRLVNRVPSILQALGRLLHYRV